MSYFNWETELVEIRFPLVEAYGVMQPADNFLKVKETLTRIGAPGYDYNEAGERTDRVLWQSCHILCKRQRYFIVHFKEMFLMDGHFKRTQLTEDDLARRNAICNLLAEWKLIELVKPNQTKTPAPAPISTIRIVSFADKKNWILDSKYEIGNPANRY